MQKRTNRPAMVERRAFVTSAAVAALIALLPEPLRRRGATAATDPIDAVWRDPASARAVGRRYLSLAPEEADAGHLLRSLIGSDAARCTLSPEGLRCEIARRRERDFAAGDTVLVDGWILARTEARICALTAIAG